jgi:hypothetical protein
MARDAYRLWRKKKHENRRKVGCFDFQIYRMEGTEEVPVTHLRVVERAPALLCRDHVERVYLGEDPWEVGGTQEDALTLQEVQLAMLEQEVNWGDEPFQAWTHFSPSSGRRPRDYLMAYLRRAFAEPRFLERLRGMKMRAASGRDVLRPPLGRGWEPFLEPEGSQAKPWLRGELLNRFRRAAEQMPDNPYYRPAYGLT